MPSPQDYLPPRAEDILAVDPEDLAFPLLRFLVALEEAEGEGELLLYNLTLEDPSNQFGHYVGSGHADVLQHIRETWGVLERRGWLAPSPTQNFQSGWKTVSSLGRGELERSTAETWASETMLPRDMDPQLCGEVTSTFIRGRSGDAVRAAFRRVEVRVREATALQSRGRRQLMIDAFRQADPARGLAQGPLLDTARGDGPESSLRMVFEGAMGAWLNEHTHEDLQIDSAGEAAELIHLANLLLRIIERRRPF